MVGLRVVASAVFRPPIGRSLEGCDVAELEALIAEVNITAILTSHLASFDQRSFSFCPSLLVRLMSYPAPKDMRSVARNSIKSF